MTTDIDQLVEALREALATLRRLRDQQWHGFEEQMPPQVLQETADCEKEALDTLVSRLKETEAQLERQEAALREAANDADLLRKSLRIALSDGQVKHAAAAFASTQDDYALVQHAESQANMWKRKALQLRSQLERQEAALRDIGLATIHCTHGSKVRRILERHSLSTPPNQDASSVTPAAADGSATKERLEPEVSPRRSEPSNLARDAAGVTPEPRYLCDNCFAGDRSSLECAERGHTGGRMRWPTPPNQEDEG